MRFAELSASKAWRPVINSAQRKFVSRTRVMTLQSLRRYVPQRSRNRVLFRDHVERLRACRRVHGYNLGKVGEQNVRRLETAVENSLRVSRSESTAAIARASPAQRSQNSVAEVFTATVRFSRVSRARYTSLIPPFPIADRISNGPSTWRQHLKPHRPNILSDAR